MSLYLSGTDDLNAFLEHIFEAEAVSYDMESAKGRDGKYFLIGLGLGTGEMACYAGVEPGTVKKKHWDLRYSPTYAKNYDDMAIAISWLTMLEAVKVAHNASADLKELNGLDDYGYTVRPQFAPIFDTMVGAALLDYDTKHLGLKYLTALVLERDIEDYNSMMEKFSAKDLTEVPELEVARYNISQVRATHDLYSNFASRIRQLKLGRALTLEMNLLPILAGMEDIGFRVDRERLQGLGDRFRELGDALQEAVADLTDGRVTKVNGPQVGKYLFGKEDGQLAQRVIYRSRKTGSPTCDERVLQKFAVREGFEWVRVLLKARQIRKLPKTYCDGIIKGLDSNDRSHTELSQVTAETGRLASKNPNHQNIPKRRAEGLEIRRCFVAKEGYKLVACDKDQIELRVLAEEAGEDHMREAFLTGQDIHMKTTMDIFGDPSMRYAGKVLNYTIAYLSGPQQIADQSKVSKGKAEMWQRKYFRRYSMLKGYIRYWAELCQERGYVLTPQGRRRDVTRFFAKNYDEGVRKSLNTRIQGGAAEIIKLDTVRLIMGGMSQDLKDIEVVRIGNHRREISHRKLTGLREAYEEGLDAKLLLQIHDEVIIEVREDQVDWAARIVKEALTSHYKTMPLPCSLKVGDNWADVKDYTLKEE